MYDDFTVYDFTVYLRILGYNSNKSTACTISIFWLEIICSHKKAWQHAISLLSITSTASVLRCVLVSEVKGHIIFEECQGIWEFDP